MTQQIIIGVTGKSGSGKSTFCNYLAKEMDADLFNLDIYSHKALANEQMIKILTRKFGTTILSGDKIDRKALGKIVFADKDKLNFLNTIVYMYMQNEIEKDLATAKNVVILDYALLPITKFWDNTDYKILLKTDQETRMKRLIERDKVSLDYIQSRDNAGLNYCNMKFDKIIDNTKNCNMEILSKQIHAQIKNKLNNNQIELTFQGKTI